MQVPPPMTSDVTKIKMVMLDVWVRKSLAQRWPQACAIMQSHALEGMLVEKFQIVQNTVAL